MLPYQQNILRWDDNNVNIREQYSLDNKLTMQSDETISKVNIMRANHIIYLREYTYEKMQQASGNRDSTCLLIQYFLLFYII